MDNPLADQQREKKGAETFGKYDYQYHWAFKKLLDEHRQKKEYAIFVEFHEDVIFANSLQKETAEFEFYQVKENSGSSQHTVNSLTKIKAGSKNSILGKLIESYQGKSFRDVISSASLVATSGFSKSIVKNELELDEITVSDINLRVLATFKRRMLDELELAECPANIRFIVPRLMPDSHRESVIAGIVDLISVLYPNSQCDAVNIYRVLIDELHRKGKITYDYSKWDSLLREKSLTSQTVQETFEAHSSIKGLSEIESLANDLISDLDLNFTKRRKLLRITNSYYARKVKNSNSLLLKFGNEVRSFYAQFQHLDTKELLEEIENSISDKLKKSMGSNDDLVAAIICEIVIGEL
tara:strand:- start:53514 stop:54575 length:1062 start_codon:yes stop_codon:yes gene_type:complete